MTKDNSKVSIATIVKTFAFGSATRGKKKQHDKKDKANEEGGNGEDASSEAEISIDERNIPAQSYTFRQMAIATNNFNSDKLIGEGGFGRVYKGHLQGIDNPVAVKRLDRSGMQGNKEFLLEVFKLSLLSHPNLVNLIGYCADGDQRMFVHEFMANGSLETHLLDLPPEKETLSWHTRMKIAEGAAKGLEYLHETASPPVIYRDFKASNILLDEDFHPKLADFGLSRNGLDVDKDHASTRVMGTYGYCAPKYGMTGQLTTKSDVYSFGVAFLELISGRRAIDPTKPTEEQNLVPWAEPLFKDRKMFMKMVDPRLGDNYSMKGLQKALAVVAMCLQEEPTIRPLISDVVAALQDLTNPTNEPESPAQNPEHSLPIPESPTKDPESPTDDHPESPTPDPEESPSEDPESPTDGHPESPTQDSEKSPSEDPESPTDDPEKSPTKDPESQTDDSESPTKNSESPSDDLESPTGIVIRRND